MLRGPYASNSPHSPFCSLSSPLILADSRGQKHGHEGPASLPGSPGRCPPGPVGTIGLSRYLTGFAPRGPLDPLTSDLEAWRVRGQPGGSLPPMRRRLAAALLHLGEQYLAQARFARHLVHGLEERSRRPFGAELVPYTNRLERTRTKTCFESTKVF
jgi:hypothetical protein